MSDSTERFANRPEAAIGSQWSPEHGIVRDKGVYWERNPTPGPSELRVQRALLRAPIPRRQFTGAVLVSANDEIDECKAWADGTNIRR